MGPPYVGGGYQSGEALEAVASYSRLETLEEQMSIINAREDARDRQLSQITVLLERIASASASSQNLAALAAGDPALGAALAAAPPPATPRSGRASRPPSPRPPPTRPPPPACRRPRARATARAAPTRSGRLASESSIFCLRLLVLARLSGECQFIGSKTMNGWLAARCGNLSMKPR